MAVEGGNPADHLAAICALVFDPQATFSVRAVLPELEGIEPFTAPDSAERRELLRLRSFVEGKDGRAEDSIRHGEEALRHDAAHPFLPLADRVSLHYGTARQAEARGQCGGRHPALPGRAAPAGGERHQPERTVRHAPAPRLLPARGRAVPEALQVN